MSARPVAWLVAALAAGAALAAQTPVEPVQVGDRVLLTVVGESTLTDTFTVGDGPALTLPEIGAVPLAGVPRGGIEDYLRGRLSQYLKNPDVKARVLIRLSVLGEVEHPGFYAVPTDIVLADALMRAGGPTRDANMSKLRIERNGRHLWDGSRLQQQLGAGKTIDALGLRAGDVVIVPRVHDTESTFRILAVLVTLPAAIYGLTRIF